jgi:ankyrin repeat protein
LLTLLGQQKRNIKMPDWHSDTLKWILSNETYLSWKECRDPCTLYLHGKSGIGKTVLSTFLWKAMRDPGLDHANRATIAYFSFVRATKDQSSMKHRGSTAGTAPIPQPASCRIEIRDLLLSLLDQILTSRRQEFPEFQKELQFLESLWPWTTDELWKLLRAVLLSPSHEGMICVVDGIDECDFSLTRPLLNLISCAAAREINLKLVVTSQLPPNKQQASLFVVDLDSLAEIRTDTQIVIKTEMNNLVQERQGFLEIKKDILGRLFGKEVTHLDTRLIFRYLHGLTSLSSLSATRREPEVSEPNLTPSSLVSIRKELDSLVLGRSNTSEYVCSNLLLRPSWVLAALSWILWSFRPLKVNELSVAVAIGISNASCSGIEERIPRDLARDLLHAVGPLVRIDNDEIHLVHESVRTALLNQMIHLYPDVGIVSAPHEHLTKVCLSYLSTIDAEDDSLSEWIREGSVVELWPSKPQFHLLDYASSYWPTHYAQAEAKSSLGADVWAFLTDSKHFAQWNLCRYSRGILALGRPPAKHVSPLEVAVEIHSIELVNKAIEKYVDMDETSKGAALDLASMEGLFEIANILLKSGISSTNALCLAAQYGHVDLVKELLRQGVDLRSTDSSYRTSLRVAVETGQEAVFDVLLGAAGREVLAEYDVDLLHFAASCGSITIMQKLLQQSETIRGPQDIITSLQDAIGAGHLDVARELIRVYPGPTDDDRPYSNPLCLAAERGQIVLVRELLQAGNHANAVARDSLTPMHFAAGSGHAQVVRELIRAGGDPNAVGTDDERSPLHWAANGGHLEATIVLLKLGSSSSASDEKNFTPLHLAAKNGHLRVVQALLDHQGGAEASTQAKGGAPYETKDKTLETTAEAPHETNDEISESESGVSVTMDSRSRPNSPSTASYGDTEYSDSVREFGETTPLHLAVEGGYAEIVKVLLGAHADESATDGFRRTPLHLAARGGHWSILKDLLAAGADVNAADDEKLAGLHMASEKGKLSIVKILLHSKADVNAATYEGHTPLLIASMNGHVELVKVFIDSGADLEATDDSHANALLLAAAKGHAEVVSVLVDAGCNIGVTNESGDAPLHMAVKARAVETVEFLLAHGADLHMKGRNGKAVPYQMIWNKKLIPGRLDTTPLLRCRSRRGFLVKAG